MEIKPPQKTTLKQNIIGVLVMIILIAGCNKLLCTSSEEKAAKIEFPATPPEQQFSETDGSHIALTNWVKRKYGEDVTVIKTEHTVLRDSVFVQATYKVNDKPIEALGIFSSDGSMLKVVIK